MSDQITILKKKSKSTCSVGWGDIPEMCHILFTFSMLIASLKCCGDALCIVDDKFMC